MFNIFLLKKKGRGSKFALPRQLRTSIKNLRQSAKRLSRGCGSTGYTEINKYRKHQTKPEGRR
jgi:hypothetical protein